MSDSIVMTMGQFRRLVREASCDAWDPFDDLGTDRRDVAAQLIVDTRPDSFDEKDWNELLRDYIISTGWSEGPPQALPQTNVMDDFELAVKACADSGGVSPGILKAAILNILRGQ
jgi:hypothetical protein